MERALQVRPQVVGAMSGVRPARADWGAWLCLGVVAYAATYVVWTCAPWDLGSLTPYFNDLADYPALVAVAVLMLRAARSAASRRVRRGWWLLMAGYVSLIVANAVYDYISIVLHEEAFPSIGDLFFLVFFPCVLLGLLSFPERLGTRNEKITFALDAVTLMVCGGTMILQFVILPDAGPHSTLKVVLSSYYPLVDMVLALSVIVILFRNLPASARMSLHVLIVGFLVMFVGDLIYSHLALTETYVGTRPSDSLWTVSYAAVAVAAHLQHRASTRSGRPDTETARRKLTSLLPYGAVVTSLVVVLFEARSDLNTSLGTLVISMTILVALVGARQIIAVRENTRILAENTTRASEARFRALVQQASDVITVVDQTGIVRYVSPAVERVFGVGVTEIEGTRFLDLTHPEDHDTVRAFLAGLVAHPTTTASATWRQRHESGRWLHVEVVGTNGLAEPTVGGVVLNARDISERVELEREREQARRDSESYQAQLMHAQKMEALGTLAGGVAHDMNNALAGIIVTAECLSDETASAEVRADAEAILLAARRAAELTRNMLGFARRGEYRNEPLRPESLITSVVAMLARTLPKGIKVETSFASALAAIDGDPAQLSHALVNLCINASDAMDQQGVLTIGAHLVTLDVEAARSRGLGVGDHVVLSVRDTGTGIAPEARDRLFEPFFTTKEQGQGTGLGLAMVYGTVKRHHGAIEVDSVPGRGSTFRILLPASSKLTALTDARQTRHSKPPAIAAAGGAGRILIVDDEQLLRATIQRALERRGFDVTVAQHGREGLEVIEREGGAFDVVLLDMAMPVMAGPEMFRLARVRYPKLRILLTSGFTSAENARALLDEGAYGLVEKPFSPALLLESIAVVMRNERIDSASANLPRPSG